MIHIIQVLLYTVLAKQLVWADISYEDIKLQVFDTKPTKFENAILKSLETTTNFWADETVEQVIGIGSAVVQFVPFGEAITTIFEAVTDLLKDESEWKNAFVTAMKKEQDNGIILNQIEWFASQMKTMKQILPLLDKEKEPNNQTRVTYAFSIHKDIYTMLDYYGSRKGLFRKYPLLTAPLLINLGLLVTVFIPLANELIPSATKQLPIACDGYDILKLYRSLTVYARLEKTNMKYLRYREMMIAMDAIDKYGKYPEVLTCERGCKNSTTFCQKKNGVSGICDPLQIASESCEKTCIGLGFNNFSHCIRDEFGSDEFEANVSPYCISDYTALIRNRVDALFPVQYLNALCKRNPRIRTGSGWVTILVGVVAAYGLIGGNWCDVPVNNPCDPFVRIYIDDQLVDETTTVDDTYIYDADHQFISSKIKKSSKIKIEVLDDDDDDNPELVLRTEGTIDDFIWNPRRIGDKLSSGVLHEYNSINLYVLWEDEFE